MLDLLSNAVSSLATLVIASIQFAVPMILLVLLVSPLHRFFSRQFKSWLKSTFAATYLVFLVLLIIAYFVPAGLGIRESALGTMPEALSATLFEQVLGYLFILVRLLVLTAFFSVLVLPLEFLGIFFFEWFSSKTKNGLAAKILAVWLTVLVTTAVVLFLIPWIVPGLLYLIYWA